MSSNAYMATYMKRRYHQRRDQAVALLGGQCVVCGTADGLEIDHTDRATKEIDLGKLWSTSFSRYVAELAKCQLLCRDHHRAKSCREMSVPHGGGASGKKNCPCGPCKSRKREYNRQYAVAKREASA